MENQELQILEVVEFTPEVAKTIRHLVAQLDDNFQPLTDEDLKDMIAAEGTHLFIAKIDSGEIVGMFTLIYYRIPYKRKGWIEDVVVDEPHRRKGFAKMMLIHAVQEAKRIGIKSLNMTSSPEREFAGELYLKLGFEKRNTYVYRMNLND